MAKDFSETCIVAKYNGKVVAFSSGYIPPNRPDTFFSWEIVVHEDFRGKGLQLRMLLHQIKMTKIKFFEGTVNPSNKISRNNFVKLSQSLNSKFEESVLFSEEDFENDGHEAEVLFRIGPIENVKDQLD